MLDAPEPSLPAARAEVTVSISHKVLIFSLPMQAVDRCIWAPVRAMQSLREVESVSYILTFHNQLVRLKADAEKPGAGIHSEETSGALLTRVFPKVQMQAGVNGYIVFAIPELLEKGTAELWKYIQ